MLLSTRHRPSCQERNPRRACPTREVRVGKAWVGGPAQRPSPSLAKPADQFGEDRSLATGCRARSQRTSLGDDAGRIGIGVLPAAAEQAAEFRLGPAVAPVHVVAGRALLARVWGSYFRGLDAEPLAQVGELLAEHRPPAVLHQAVHAPRQVRRAEVQPLDHEFSGRMDRDQAVQRRAHQGAQHPAHPLH